MARDQGLVINPAKISGVCGRLLCCINYEYAQYEEVLRHYPAVNQLVKTPKGEGKVISIAKISGVCGRLLCCINYEYAQYEEVLRHYPAVNQLVKTPKGEGKVISISPLNGYLFVDVATIGMMRFETLSSCKSVGKNS